MRIGIIAGHTDIVGKDRGAIGHVVEGTVNRQQATACYNELKNYRCQPLLEPEGYPLASEIAWVNRNKLDLAVAMHNNAGGGDGWEALVSVTGSGDKLARVAEKHIKALGQNSRGIKKRRNASGGNWYGFIRQTECTAVIFETAFVDNAEDVKFIDTEAKNITIGKAYAKAIAERYGLKKKSGSIIVPGDGGGSQVKYRTTWSVPIYGGGPVDVIVGWTQRDQVISGTVTGSYLRLGAGQYVSIKAGSGVMKVHRYKVLNDMYYRIDPNYKTHTPPRIAKAGTIVEGTYYESDKMLRLDRGLYLPEYLKGKKMMQRI